VITAQLELQRATLPGKVDGIVGWDPLELQCRDCGSLYVGERRRAGADIILSGFHFHICEGRDGKRRCPDCLAVVKAACPKGHP
jgi:hypothetical protein